MNPSRNRSSWPFFGLTAFSLVSLLTLSGCLQTRSAVKEQEEKQVIKKQLSTLQQSTADVNSRFQEIEDENRRLLGRIEVLENKLGQTTAQLDASGTTVEGKLKEKDDAYREEFAKLALEIENLKAQLASLREDQVRSAKTQAAAQAKKNGAFEVAEEMFSKKDWKTAALEYERYRKANPKGKQFATATYKIGVSFQEMGLIEEAKAFYEEVVSKFPKSKDAERAKTRLKNLKKS